MCISLWLYINYAAGPKTCHSLPRSRELQYGKILRLKKSTLYFIYMMLLRIGRDVGTFVVLILKCTDDSGLSFIISWLCQRPVQLWPAQCKSGLGVPRLLWFNCVSCASAPVLPEMLLQAVHQWGIRRHLTTLLHVSELLQLLQLLCANYLYMKDLSWLYCPSG